MYESKLAVALKSAGKVLRELKDTVYIPFGSEYSILIKNLNTVRAQLKITVDGQDATDGLSIVVDPNSDLELERFITNGNLAGGNRFKFIERTSKIEQHRGVKVEDGLIRVEFQFEKVFAPSYYPSYPFGRVWPYNHQDGVYGGTAQPSSGTLRSMSLNATSTSTYASDVQCDAMANMVYDSHQVERDVGITVPGSKSDQKFQTVLGFPLEQEKHVIVLKILGETEQGKKVVQAVTVKTKQKCPTCGHMNKANAKFCSECGTGLEIV